MKKTIPAVLALTALFSAHEAVAQKAYIEAGYASKSLDLEGTIQNLNLDKVEINGAGKPKAVQFDGNTTDFKVGTLYGRYGYNLTPYIAVEGEFGFGIGTDSVSTLDAEELAFLRASTATVNRALSPARVDLYGDIKALASVGLYGKAILPVTSDFSVFVRAGLAFQQFEFNNGRRNQSRADRSGFAYGGGFSYDLTDAVYVRADYTRVSYDNLGTSALFIRRGYGTDDKDENLKQLLELSRMDADVDQFSVSLGFRF